jgi:hypothetical protein
MKRSVYLLGFLTSLLFSFGAMFKMMHWPFANILMFTGFLVLNFGFLPAYFYKKYRAAA